MSLICVVDPREMFGWLLYWLGKVGAAHEINQWSMSKTTSSCLRGLLLSPSPSFFPPDSAGSRSRVNVNITWCHSLPCNVRFWNQVQGLKKSIAVFPLSDHGLFPCRPKKSPGAWIIIFSVPRFLLSSSRLCCWSLSTDLKNIACSHCAFQGSTQSGGGTLLRILMSNAWEDHLTYPAGQFSRCCSSFLHYSLHITPQTLK